MGPRMSAAGSGPQLGFIQRKTALSRHMHTRFSDGPSDGLRGSSRYLASLEEQIQRKWKLIKKKKCFLLLLSSGGESLRRKRRNTLRFSFTFGAPRDAVLFFPCLFRLRGCHSNRGRKDYSSSSEEEERVPPSLSLLSLPSFKNVGNDSGGEKEVWVSVFTYLNRAELLACMTVCKAWYKW